MKWPYIFFAVLRVPGVAWLCSAVLLALSGCSGTAVVTMTSTPSQDNFLAYRVTLVSVQLQGSGGKSGLTVLPESTIVDFASLTSVDEVLSATAISKGTYTSALITLDYSSAQIVYDDGSVNGIVLSPIGANGQAVGQVQLTVNLDPSDSFSISSKGASQLAIDFNLAASNIVNSTAKTVTVTPLFAASAAPIDAKLVRVRGQLESVAEDSSGATNGAFTMTVMPFNSIANGSGRLSIVPISTTAYEISGAGSTGSTGLGQLAGLDSGTLVVAYGSLVDTSAATTTTTTTDGVTTTTDEDTTTSAPTVAFGATQVLAAGSVQGAGLDRVSGIVAARSGDTVNLEDATLIGADGSNTFLGGTTSVIMGANTVVTEFGQGGTAIDTTAQVSVGSTIDAFGLVNGETTENAILDASAGRVRLDGTSASGLVTVQDSGTLNLNLSYLGGRTVAALDFVDTGAAAGNYVVDTGTESLDVANSTVGVPVIVTGFTSLFGAAAPNFTAFTLLDPTTIQAQLVVDWGSGSAAPFTTFNSSEIDINVTNSSIGPRHEIQVGAQTLNAIGLGSDPLIIPQPTSSNTVFTIGHSSSLTTENFNTYAAFIVQLQTELNGTTLATGITAVGQYTASTFTLSATSITVFLNN
jgi:hypothetical protein